MLRLSCLTSILFKRRCVPSFKCGLVRKFAILKKVQSMWAGPPQNKGSINSPSSLFPQTVHSQSNVSSDDDLSSLQQFMLLATLGCSFQYSFNFFLSQHPHHRIAFMAPSKAPPTWECRSGKTWVNCRPYIIS